MFRRPTMSSPVHFRPNYLRPEPREEAGQLALPDLETSSHLCLQQKSRRPVPTEEARQLALRHWKMSPRVHQSHFRNVEPMEVAARLKRLRCPDSRVLSPKQFARSSGGGEPVPRPLNARWRYLPHCALKFPPWEAARRRPQWVRLFDFVRKRNQRTEPGQRPLPQADQVCEMSLG